MNILLKKSNLEKLFSATPKYFEKTIEYLTWNISLSIRGLVQLLKKELPKKAQLNEIQIKELLSKGIFSIIFTSVNLEYTWTYRLENVELYLPQEIRLHFRHFFKKPKSWKIQALSSSSIKNNFSDEQAILKNIDLALQFFNAGLYQKKVSYELSKAVYSKLQKTVSLQEFYPKTKDKNLKKMRVSLVAEAVFHFHDRLEYSIRSSLSPVEKIKAVYSSLLERFNCLENIFDDLKGKSKIHDIENYDIVFPQIHAAIQELEEKKWYELENFLFNAYTDFKLTTLFGNINNYTETYYKNFGDEGFYIAKYSEGIKALNIVEYLMKPLWKSCIAMMAALGVLELKCEEPVNIYAKETGQDYLSRYDGITHFKLTELGEYLLEKIDHYEVENIPTQFQKHVFDEERTWIHFDPKDKILELSLKDFGEKMGSRVYKINESSFLKNCKSRNEVRRQIKEFKTRLKVEEVPKIWENFFSNLMKRFEAIKLKKDLFVFEFNNEELKKLWIKHPELMKLSIKVQGGMVAFFQDDLETIRKHVKKMGYFF